MDDNQNNNQNNVDDEKSLVKQVYGDYEVLKPIGKGKFAVVYRAQRVTDGLIVALKRISVDQIDSKAREKCLKEVRLLQSLDHPNIIKYLDSFISENDLVIVVEWAAAGDLKRQLRKAQERGIGFEERIIWKYFSQITDAMKHMHEKRIMHRDLKPANIFLTLDGTVKVGDLGLSRELSEHTVQAHSKVGTPLYMSPEVLRGDGYDFKSDIWSLGCILYELAMLKSPFKAEGLNLYGLFQKISAGDFQPIPDNYSEELRTLVYSMMSAKAEDRPEISHVCSIASTMREKFTKIRSRTVSSNNVNVDNNNNNNNNNMESDVKDINSNSRSNSASNKKLIPSYIINNNNNNNIIEDNGNLLNDYKFSGYNENKLAHLEDHDAMIRIPSANSQSSANTTNNNKDNKFNKFNNKNNNKNDDKSELVKLNNINTNLSPSKTNPKHLFSQNNNNADNNNININNNINNKFENIGIDEDEGSTSANIPTIVKPTALPVQKSLSNGISRPDSASRNGRINNKNNNNNNEKEKVKETLPNLKSNDNIVNNQNNKNNNNINNTLNKNNKINDKLIDSNSSNNINFINNNNNNNNNTNNNTNKTKLQAKITYETEINEPYIENNTNNNKMKQTMSNTFSKTIENTNRLNSTERIISTPEDVNIISSKYTSMNASAELLELLYPKLIILGYPFRNNNNNHKLLLTPYHFSCDISLLGGKNNIDTTSQFHKFIEIVQWLCTELGQSNLLSKWDIDTDSPMLLAKQSLLVAQAAGVPSNILSSDNIPPSSLICGYGEKVCLLLTSLCDVLLTKRNYKFQPLIHHDNDKLEINEYDDKNNDIDDNNQISEDIDDFNNDLLNNLDYEEEKINNNNNNNNDPLLHSIILTTIDPILWKEETLRVSQKLIDTNNNNNINNGNSWLGHIETIKNYYKNIIENNNNNNNNLMNELLLYMKQLDNELLNQNSRISRYENTMISSSILSSLSSSYSLIKQDLNKYESSIQLLNKVLEEKSNNLNIIETDLENTQEKYKEKYGNISGDSNDNSSNIIVKIKSSIRNIKNDIAQLTIREGVQSNALLQLKMNEKRIQRNKKLMYYKNKRKGQNKNINNNNNNDYY